MPYRRSSRKADRVRRYVRKDGTVREYRYPAHGRPPEQCYAPDSLAALIVAFRTSPHWAQLRASSRKNYEGAFKWLAGIDGLPAGAVTRTMILDLRDAVFAAHGPGAAITFTRVFCTLFNWAVDRGKLPFNPAQRIKPAAKLQALPTWTEEEYQLALANLPERLRRAVILGACTGQRVSDLISLTWDQVTGGRIRLTQRKTGEPISIPIHPELATELARWRQDAVVGRTILLDRRGRPWTPVRLDVAMRRALDAIPGLRPRLNMHGLRKLMATRLAELGASAHEIGAITGHRTLAMIEHYTRAARQERLADAAIDRFDKIGTKGTK
jgi:integrase